MRQLAGALLALAAPVAFAASPTTPPPDAGSILKQVQPATAPPPAPTGTGLTIEPDGGINLARTEPFLVRAIQIEGNTLFDTETLHALVAEAEGQSLTLLQLQDRVARLTRYYRDRGYLLSRAIIPQQSIQSGSVRIAIIEARYGSILLENRSRVHDRLLRSTLAPLRSGQAIMQKPLDHTLLLLADVPGVVVNASLKPGQAVGTSDLVVEAPPVPALSGNVVVDNSGNRFTGRARLGGTVSLIDPLHHGDTFSLSGVSSGRDMAYGRLGYDAVLNGAGTRAGISFSTLHYRLGDGLRALDAHGTATVESAWARQPLVRSADTNLYGQIQVDHLQLSDRIDAAAINTDRHLNLVTANLSGDVHDGWLTGGVTYWTAGMTLGHVGFDDTAAQSADAATTHTAGHYLKWNASLYRLQRVDAANSVYLAVTGQWTNVNLDSSQKLLAGGPYTVRAYDMGAISGDTGCQVTVEFRHNLAFAWHGHWQTLAFVDSAHLTINQNRFEAGENSANLSGVGAGLNWTGFHQWNARATIATRIGPAPELVKDPGSLRVWIEFSKWF